MNINNSRKKVVAMTKGLLSFCMLGALPFVTGCSDTWDDHYDSQTNVGSGATIWETISGDEQLSNFTRVVKACGYDVPLNSSQVFTVFAPVNGDFTSEQADALIEQYNIEKSKGTKDKDNPTVKEFLRNHISLFNYSVSSSTNDSISMMNGKLIPLTSSSFGGRDFVSTNTLLGNGMLFTLKNKVDYTPNVFEYLRGDNELDSVAAFLYKYNRYEFDASQSVPGEIKDGQTIYLDSVEVLSNVILGNIGFINDEDSTYWMVVPTNSEWKRLVPEYREYFNYCNLVTDRDSLQEMRSKLFVLAGTVFSQTDNPRIADATVDSVMSTNAVPYSIRKRYYGNSDLKYYQYGSPYAPGGVFDGTIAMDCSNGKILKAADWHVDKYQTFFQQIYVETEATSSKKSLGSGTRELSIVPVPMAVDSIDSEGNILSVPNKFYNKVSNNSYVEIAPTGGSNPSASFYLPYLLSNVGYDIYVVMAPALAGNGMARESERLPNKFRCQLRWQEQGADSTVVYIDGTENAGKSSHVFDTKKDGSSTVDVMDTILVAKNWKFPTCTYGANDPRIQAALTIESRVGSADFNNGRYQRIMRLDCIILKPHKESAKEPDEN